MQVNFHLASDSDLRGYFESVAESCQYALNEEKPDAGGFLVGSAARAGIALFADTGKVLGPDADAGVLNNKRLALGVNAYLAAVGVFERVRKDLLNNESKPFFVCQNRQLRFLKRKLQLLQ